MKTKLSFLGGARQVGRSCLFVEYGDRGIMLDAGVSLSGNDSMFPLDPPNPPSALILTHAHLDHAGFAPSIVSKYHVPLIGTPPTQDLSETLNIDYVKLQKDASPYTFTEIMNVRKHSVDVLYKQPINLGGEIEATLLRAGHILGSAMVRLKIGDHVILYTGDICARNTRTQTMVDVSMNDADTIIIESTYSSPSDQHPSLQKIERDFAAAVAETLTNGGVVLIPVFAVGRAQEVMLCLEAYVRSGIIPRVPIFIDGMIRKVNVIYRMYWFDLSDPIKRQIRYTKQNPLESNLFIEVESRKDVLKAEEPMIIISTSGMLEGGPILYYLKIFGADPKNLICLTGYQVPGTRGRLLYDGQREIQLEGESLRVEAQVKFFDFSAHADYPGLLRFLSFFKNLERVFCVHGEEKKVLNFCERIESLRKVEAYAPRNGETITL
ncbi:MAG: MBL fold metallo-hydrolase RNA specificity domain-containing protein [Candidatus Freyarchaeota archaeon]|nr:MBL fold metallo-hydrolase RNA specificity domain-containing protein [Candidatus Freyrarchaeum guaymaensis]